MVNEVRSAVAEAFAASVAPGTRISREVHEDLVRRLIDDAVRDRESTQAVLGHPKLPQPQRAALIGAVLDALFGAGRFQSLISLPNVENIEVEGYDRICLTYADGSVSYPAPLFESDAELLEEVAHLARIAGTGERDFSPASPSLRMRLPDGSRLAADAWVCDRPSVTIRVHRYVDTDLREMVKLGAIDVSLQQFLFAAIKAGLSILIAGDPAAGKTTLSRAVLAALHPDVRIATIETWYELGLHDMHDRHKRVWASEAQPGGERGADGRRIGQVTLSDLVSAALQKNVQRIVVGETTGGDEVMAMMEAMQAGKGCLTTIHAGSARETLDRVATMIMGVRPNASMEYASRMIAQHVDVIVHLAYRTDPVRHISERYVDEIITLAPSSEPGVPAAITNLYAPGPDGRARPTGEHLEWLDRLVEVGFDPGWLRPGVSTWGQPTKEDTP